MGMAEFGGAPVEEELAAEFAADPEEEIRVLEEVVQVPLEERPAPLVGILVLGQPEGIPEATVRELDPFVAEIPPHIDDLRPGEKSAEVGTALDLPDVQDEAVGFRQARLVQDQVPSPERLYPVRIPGPSPFPLDDLGRDLRGSRGSRIRRRCGRNEA